MTRIATLFKLTRINFVPASVLAFFMGSALAFREGYAVSPSRFFAAMIGVAAGHLAANTLNNYCDHASGADSLETQTTPFFGGTKVICSEEASPAAALLTAAILVFMAFISVWAVFVMTADAVFIILAVTAAFLGAEYTARPLRFSYRGMGEAVIFFLFGPMLVSGSFYLFSGFFSIGSFLLSLVPGGLIFSVIVLNEIPDADTDKKAGKNNLVVIAGKELAVFFYVSGAVVSALSLAVSVLKGILPPFAMAILLPYAAIFAVFAKMSERIPGAEGMSRFSGITVATHALVTLLVTAVLIVS